MADTLETIEVEVKYRASGATTALKGVTSAVKGLSKSVKSAKNPLENFVSSLKRIAFYRFIRSIIKGITEAFKEGLEKAYIFSSRITTEGHRFAAALDKMQSRSNQMKGQIGSAFAGLLTAIQPIILKIIDIITRAADAVSQFFAAFTGKTYLKAVATTAQFADTTAKGAKAAKEWKNQLLGFDEINRLNDTSDDGSAGKDPLTGYNFKDTPISNGILNFVSKLKEGFSGIKEWITGIDWQNLGVILWGKLKSLFADNGQAQKCIEGLASVLGAALGGLAGLLWGFIKSAVKDIFRSFKQNVKDYDGNDKITIFDIVLSAIKTAADVHFGLYSWLYEHVVKPFFTSLYEAFFHPAEGETPLDIGKKIMEGLLNGAEDWFKDNSESKWKPLWLAIIKLAKLIFGIKSPSTVFYDIGSNIMQGLYNGLTSVWSSVYSWLLNAFNTVVSYCSSISSWAQSAINSIGNIGRSSASLGEHSGHSGTFASGGYPTEGQMFFARESGPELVGTIGGRTAVANNDQIVSAVAQGVYQAVSSAMSNSGGNGGVTEISIDGRKLAEVLYPYNKSVAARHGANLIAEM